MVTEREHVEIADAADAHWEALEARNWPFGTQARVLSRAADGSLTALLRLPAGFLRPAGTIAAACEHLVLSGVLRVGSELQRADHYAYVPPGSGQPVWSTREPTELLIKIEGPPDLEAGDAAPTPGALSIDTAEVEWMANPIPGTPGGLVVKLLRLVEATGEMTAIVANCPRFSYPSLEFHESVEEMFLLDGDMRLGNSGIMRPGSYFWRPGFITHGPFYSHSGALFFLWTETTLVNHVPSSPAATPEENRRQAGL